MKCRLQVENFSGKSTLSVYQDFHAKVFSKNLTTIIANSAKATAEKRAAECGLDYQINFAQALSKMKPTMVLLFVRPAEAVYHIVSKLQNIFSKTLERVRPGRKYKRNHKLKLKKFHFAYKPLS